MSKDKLHSAAVEWARALGDVGRADADLDHAQERCDQYDALRLGRARSALATALSGLEDDDA